MEESSFPIAVFIPVIFLIVFPLFWSLICVLIGAVGGWRRLAQDYANDRDMMGDTFRMRSGRFGMLASYSSVLNVTVGMEGISLRPIIFFRPGHQPILLPWHEMTSIEFGSYFLQHASTLHIRSRSGGNEVSLHLYGKDIASAIQQHGPPEYRIGDDYER